MVLRTLVAGVCFVPALIHGSLVAHWKFDSTAADETASFIATWAGTPAYVSATAAPESSAAADLAAGSWLGAGTPVDFERHQGFSVSAWIRGGAQDSTVVGDMVQAEGYRGWELHVGTGENGADPVSLTVWLVNDYPANAIQVNAAVPVLDGEWHHVAFTYDGSSSAAGLKIYIDGVPVAVAAGLDSLGADISNAGQAQLNIGTRMNGAAHNFTGAIDEVALFNHELSAVEMASVFSSGVESVTFPYVADSMPLPGQSVNVLTTAEVVFSVPVQGIDAGDLQVNGVPATGVTVVDSRRYRFEFPAPPQGDVHFSWASSHGITGLNGTPAQPAAWSSRYAPILPAPQLAIAEFLTQNAGGYADEDFDTPDWIELVNPGTADVNTGGWALTDDPLQPRRWVLPAMTLRPGQRKIVFASGKNRTPPAGVWHADFKLSTAPGYLALSDPAGNRVHIFDRYPQQEANVSFGLLLAGKPADGRAGWRYLNPTPGTAPSGTVYSGAAIAEMGYFPEAPQQGQTITVTMRLSPETVPSSTPVLRYRYQFGTELQTLFYDDGLHGDGAAGDKLWTAVIPQGGANGQMVRWKTSVTSNFTVSRWPINTAANASLPLYEGTVIGGGASGYNLPVYQFYVGGYAFPTSTNQSGIDSELGARGAFYANGKLYENVLIRIKGTTSRNLMKRSHRVDFNPGRDFEWSPDYPPQRELNLNSEYVDPSYLRQNMQLWMHRDSGNAGAPHFPVRLLMNGQNWQLAFHTYPADSELIEVMGLNPRGSLYKQVETLSTGTNPEKKSRRWEGNSDYVALRTGIASSAPVTSKWPYVFDNLNLPAVINYLAVARIAQEGDDVWANMVVYRDSDGTGEWRPIPFDLNLSFGQLFYGGDWPNTVVDGINDWNKSHPLYGSVSCIAETGNGTYNRLYDVIIQNPVTREMLLRRMRTLMDRYLLPPGTLPADSPMEARLDEMAALIGPDAVIDRTRWALPPTAGPYGLGPGISPSQGVATMKSNFIVPRRGHLYVTHSVNNTEWPIGLRNWQNAGIPDAQLAAAVVNFGTVLARPPSGVRDEEYIELVNPGVAAVDVSDWLLRGSGGSFAFLPGTVIPAGKSLYVSPDVKTFRSRSTSPRANESRFVTGPYSGHLSVYGETLVLEDSSGETVAQFAVAPDPNAPAVSLRVTEIMSGSAHVPNTINGDWWELTNTAAQAVDLTSFSWDDSRQLAGQAIFPPVILSPGESLIVLNEDDADEAKLFRSAWGLPASVKILTRADFRLPDLRGLGAADSVVVYLPDGTEAARADYPEHATGRSRMWFRNGVELPGGYGQTGKFGAVASTCVPGDIASPGFAGADPVTLTDPYEIWAAAHDLWSTSALADADPDGDGRSNRAEYVFGGAPETVDFAPHAAMQRTGEGIDWSFVHRTDDPAVVIGLESSPDLITWTDATLSLVVQAPVPEMPGYVRSTYRIVPSEGARFFRASGN